MTRRPEKGAFDTVKGKRILLGNAKFLARQGVDMAPLADEADRLRADGATAIFMGAMDRRRRSSPSPIRSGPRRPMRLPR